MPSEAPSRAPLPFVDVEFEVAFFDDSIRKDHLAIAMLDPFDPLALVDAAISPLHLSIAITLIFLVLSLVLVSTCPLKDTIALFFI